MRPAPTASLTEAPAPGLARVVFLHGSASDEHGVGTVRVVDEAGRFLGDSVPDSWFSADVQPGAHAFFGWLTFASGELPAPRGCACVLHECWWVAAARAELEAGRTYYIWVQTTVRYGSNGEESAWDDQLDFVRVSPRVDEWPRATRDALQALEPARAAGSAVSAPDVYRDSFVCVGKARMSRGTYWDAKRSTLRPQDGS